MARGLRPAGPGADRQHCVAPVVLAPEEQLPPRGGVLAVELGGFAGDVRQQVLISVILGELE